MNSTAHLNTLPPILITKPRLQQYVASKMPFASGNADCLALSCELLTTICFIVVMDPD